MDSTSQRFASPADALRSLFSAWPADRGEGTGFAEAYVIAIERYSLRAIEAAVLRLIRGEVDGIDHRFLPTPAQLGNLVATMEKLYAPVERPLALPAPGGETLTEEDVERRRKMAERARQIIGTQRGRSEPIPTPAEEFDAWEKREQERLRVEGLPKLSPHLVADAKQKLADAQRVAEALMAAEEAAEARRQKMAKGSDFSKVSLSPTQPRTGKERDAA